MHQKRFFMVIIAAAGLLTLSACQETDQDRISDAQYCLDEARDAVSANACIASIKDLKTEASYILQCSAAFIGQGFSSASKLSNTLDQLQGNGGTAALLGLMAFDTKANAAAAFDVCTKSNQKAMGLLAAMSRSATLIASASVGAIDDLIANPENASTIISAAIQELLDDPVAFADDIEAIGETVATVYQSSCNSGSQVNADLCGQISDALGNPAPGEFSSVDPAVVADYLLNLWKTP
ncbi:hypothetical protein D3C87_175160 [compost metagenome]